jgi:hypothetical protein
MWQTEEIKYFHKYNKRIIPVFLEGADISILPAFLKNRTGIFYKKDDPEALNKLIWGITGKRNLYEDTKE